MLFYNLISSILNIFLFDISFAEDPCLLELCNGTYPSKSFVEVFCKEHEGLMNERCCISNNTVIGLDFRSCEIEIFNATGYNLTDLIIMDLSDNNLKKLTSDDLTGLIHLDELYLSLPLPCPGGQKAWNHTSTNLTLNLTLCSVQINPCKDLEINCTENGRCIHKGPGSAKCECIEGHHGYKCLNEGEFPVITYLTSLATCTLILCVLLWFSVGRDAHKKI